MRSHDPRAEQDVLLELISTRMAAMAAAGDTEADINEEILSKYGAAITAFITIDALAYIAELQQKRINQAGQGVRQAPMI